MLDLLMYRRRWRGANFLSAMAPEFVLSLGYDWVYKDAESLANTDNDNVQHIISEAPGAIDKSLGQYLGGQPVLNAVTSYTSTGGSEAITLTANSLHWISYTVTGVTAGTVRPQFTGGVTQSGVFRSANGSYTELLETDASTALALTVAGSFDGVITNIELKEISLPVLSQTVASSQPALRIGAGATTDSRWLHFDGANRLVAGGLNLANLSNCSLIIAAQITNTSGIFCAGVFPSEFIAGYESGGSGKWKSGGNTGIPAMWVDNVQIGPTRDDLYQAIKDGLFHIIEVRNLDLSSWGLFGISNYHASAWNIVGDVNMVIITPSANIQTEADRIALYNIAAKGTGVTF